MNGVAEPESYCSRRICKFGDSEQATSDRIIRWRLPLPADKGSSGGVGAASPPPMLSGRSAECRLADSDRRSIGLDEAKTWVRAPAVNTQQPQQQLSRQQLQSVVAASLLCTGVLTVDAVCLVRSLPTLSHASPRLEAAWSSTFYPQRTTIQHVAVPYFYRLNGRRRPLLSVIGSTHRSTYC